MNMKKILNSLLIAIALLATPVIARAQIIDSSKCSNISSNVCQDIKNTPGKSNLELFGPDGPVTKITSFLAVLMGITAFIILIYSGYMYITSGGDSKKVSTAKTTIIYAAIGIVIALSAQAIVNFILVNIK